MLASLSKPRAKSSSTLLYRLLGYTSLGVSLLTLLFFWYRQHRRQKTVLPPPNANGHPPTTINTARTSSSFSSVSPPPSPDTASIPAPPRDTFTSRLFSNVLSGSTSTRRKKILTISMKNTILWNPSPDPTSPNHAFYEHSIPLLRLLSQHFHIYLIIHTASPQHLGEETERSQIQDLLNATNLFVPSSSSSSAASAAGLDPRKTLFCATEEGKVHIVRHLEPAVHVEGGYLVLEDDDGAEVVKKVSVFVPRVVWCRRRRRISMGTRGTKEEVEEWVRDRKGIEICGRLVESSLAKEVGLEMRY